MTTLKKPKDNRTEDKIKEILRALLTKLGVWQYWPVSNGMGRHGIPDCLFCFKGHFCVVETKRPNKKGTKGGGISPLQRQNLKELKANQALSFVAYDEEDIQLLMKVLGEMAPELDLSNIELDEMKECLCIPEY